MPGPIRIDISSPCLQNWQDMSASSTGRYCQSCRLPVIDFSVLSDQEIFNLINKSTSKVCGRLKEDQMNRVFYPATKPERTRLWQKIWQLIVASTLVAGEAKSQARNIEQTVLASTFKNSDDSLAAITASLDENACILIDATNKEPLPGATVIFDNNWSNTDNNGVFRIGRPVKKLTFMHVGYNLRTLTLDDKSLPKIIALERSMEELDAVTVTAPSASTQCSYALGGISVVRKVTRGDTLIQRMSQWIPNRAVRVFPNPVARGATVQVQISLKKMGAYSLRLFSSDGKLMHTQPLSVTFAKQQVQLQVPAGCAAGTYWLVIQNIESPAKPHEIKLVLK